jgi:hypothetical protein
MVALVAWEQSDYSSVVYVVTVLTLSFYHVLCGLDDEGRAIAPDALYQDAPSAGCSKQRRWSNGMHCLGCQDNRPPGCDNWCYPTGQPRQGDTAKGIASACRVDFSNVLPTHVGTLLPRNDQGPLRTKGDKEQSIGACACLRNAAEQPCRFVFVHKKDVGMGQEGTHVRRFAIDQACIRPNRDTGLLSCATSGGNGLHKIELSLGRTQGSDMHKGGVLERFWEECRGELRFGTPGRPQQGGSPPAMMCDL